MKPIELKNRNYWLSEAICFLNYAIDGRKLRKPEDDIEKEEWAQEDMRSAAEQIAGWASFDLVDLPVEVVDSWKAYSIQNGYPFKRWAFSHEGFLVAVVDHAEDLHRYQYVDGKPKWSPLR